MHQMPAKRTQHRRYTRVKDSRRTALVGISERNGINFSLCVRAFVICFATPNKTTAIESAPLFPTHTHRKAGHVQVHGAALAKTEALDLEHSPGILLYNEVMYHPAGWGGLQQASERSERSRDQHPRRKGCCCTSSHRHQHVGV